MLRMRDGWRDLEGGVEGEVGGEVGGEECQLPEDEEGQDLYSRLLSLPQLEETTREAAVESGHTAVVGHQRLDVSGGNEVTDT